MTVLATTQRFRPNVGSATDIQNAIDAAEGVVDRLTYVALTGTYEVDDTVNFDGVLIKADPSTVINAIAGSWTAGKPVVESTGVVHSDGRLNVSGEDLAEVAVHLSAASGSTFSGSLTVRDAELGLLMDNATSCRFDRLQAANCVDGIILDSTGATIINQLQITGCTGTALELKDSYSAGGIVINGFRIEDSLSAIKVNVRGLAVFNGGHIEGGRIVITSGHVRINDTRFVGPNTAQAMIEIVDCDSCVISGVLMTSTAQISSYISAPQALIDGGYVVVENSWRPFGANPLQEIPLIGI